jgi:hypothetical protein
LSAICRFLDDYFQDCFAKGVVELWDCLRKTALGKAYCSSQLKRDARVVNDAILDYWQKCWHTRTLLAKHRRQEIFILEIVIDKELQKIIFSSKFYVNKKIEGWAVIFGCCGISCIRQVLAQMLLRPTDNW